MKPKHTKTRIVCTIGPASRSEQKLTELMRAGMGMARLNFAHGNLEQHAADIRRIREISEREGIRCPILIDLPGPKIRLGKLRHEPLQLHKGQIIWLTTRKILRLFHDSLPVDYPQLTLSVKKGSLIYLNDGFVQLRVEDMTTSIVRCEVLVGGSMLS